jgi:hypothetical protein
MHISELKEFMKNFVVSLALLIKNSVVVLALPSSKTLWFCWPCRVKIFGAVGTAEYKLCGVITLPSQNSVVPLTLPSKNSVVQSNLCSVVGTPELKKT